MSGRLSVAGVDEPALGDPDPDPMVSVAPGFPGALEELIGQCSSRGGRLRSANLRSADLAGADLRRAYLTGADLTGATLPDGRTFEAYRRDPLLGICDDPAARERALAAWGSRSWTDCPMHAAHGWNDFGEVPADKLLAVGAFVALLDGNHLPAAQVTP